MTARKLIGLSGILVLAILLGCFASQGKPGARKPSAIASPDIATQPPAPAVPSREVLLKRAWELMASYTSGEYAHAPRWELSDWQTKCDVGLDKCADHKGPVRLFESDPFNGPFLKTDNSKTDHLLLQLSESLRLPVQDEGEPGTDNAKTKPRRFASVQFDPDAAKILKADVARWSNGDHRPFSHDGKFVLAKAIWTFVPLDESGKSTSDANQRFLVTNVQGIADEGWKVKDPESVDLKSFLSPTLDASVRDIGMRGCSPRAKGAIPLRCLRAIPLRVLKPRDTGGSTERETTAALSDTCGSNRCLAILMGIHFMVHLCPNDPLFAHSPWLFVTFWWNGEDNGQALPAPWKYFAANAVQDERDDSADVHPGERRIVFNPYLEGVRQNGAVANCVTCHSFAAVNGGNPPNSLLDAGAGVCLGSPPIPRTNLDQYGHPCTAQQRYSQAGVATADRIWSLAHLNDPPE